MEEFYLYMSLHKGNLSQILLCYYMLIIDWQTVIGRVILECILLRGVSNVFALSSKWIVWPKQLACVQNRCCWEWQEWMNPNKVAGHKTETMSWKWLKHSHNCWWIHQRRNSTPVPLNMSHQWPIKLSSILNVFFFCFYSKLYILVVGDFKMDTDLVQERRTEIHRGDRVQFRVLWKDKNQTAMSARI